MEDDGRIYIMVRDDGILKRIKKNIRYIKGEGYPLKVTVPRVLDDALVAWIERHKKNEV